MTVHPAVQSFIVKVFKRPIDRNVQWLHFMRGVWPNREKNDAIFTSKIDRINIDVGAMIVDY